MGATFSHIESKMNSSDELPLEFGKVYAKFKRVFAQINNHGLKTWTYGQTAVCATVKTMGFSV